MELKYSLKPIVDDMGIQNIRPFVRSSDYSLCLSDPFLYLLTRRLGLTRAFSWSRALSRGSWFAERMLHIRHPDPASPLSAKLGARLEELNSIARSMSIPEEERKQHIERERRDYACAIGWYEATRDLPLISGLSYENYFNSSRWEWCGSELVATTEIAGAPCRAQFDHLYYNRKTNRVWVVDDKTTSYHPDTRLRVCPNEFQSQLYTAIAEKLLEEGALKNLGVPDDAKMGGMIHVAFAKPTIDFGSKDRPYRWISDGKRSGKRGVYDPRTRRLQIFDRDTGEVLISRDSTDTEENTKEILHGETGKKPEKQLEGEPDLDLYIERCRRWYRSEGEYEDPENPNPVRIAISFLNMDWFESVRDETYQRIRLVNTYRTSRLLPLHFPKGQNLLTQGGALSAYAPFYVNEPDVWPSLMLDARLVSRHRDEIDRDAAEVAESEITPHG